MEVLLLVVIAAIILWITIASIAKKRRREFLMAKYGDVAVVEAIMARKVWQGMTKEQLVDSWGRPADVDEKVYRAKRTETYKYNQIGRNRFKDRVVIENDIVIGWQQR